MAMIAISRATWQHLRFPFSFFLMPIFLFALAVHPTPWQVESLLMFAIWHLLVYPASNGYNSFFDKDEESIGGLEKPPPVDTSLYYTAWGLDILALLLSLFVSVYFAVGVLIYGLVSKAYSHPAIRLKKYPIVGWLVVGFFQGAFTFWIIFFALAGSWELATSAKALWGALLSSVMLWGSYPMTQVYQHGEDARRGDKTLSLLLGIKGTFLFTLVFFSLATAGFTAYFFQYASLWVAVCYPLALLPTVVFFLYWFWQVWQEESKANYINTMRLNLLSAFCLNLFFGTLLLASA